MVLKKKRIVYFSLLEDLGVLQEELKIKQRAVNRKSALTLQWLIWDECVSNVGTWDDPCDLARYCQGHPRWARETRLLLGTQVKIKPICAIAFEITRKNLASFSICVAIATMSWECCFGPSDWQPWCNTPFCTNLVLVMAAYVFNKSSTRHECVIR